MAIPVFAGIPIAFSPRPHEEPRVRKAQFGDGYALRSADGLNTQLMKVTVPLRGIPGSQKDAVLSFLRTLGGVSRFYWTVPGDKQRCFIAPSWDWNRTDSTTDRWDMDIVMEEVPDL